MHAEIAAAVAREHTPGLSADAAARLEELLGRSPSVLELEVYAALLRDHGVELGNDWPLRLALGDGTAAALTVASGRGAGVAAALGLTAAGIKPLAVVLALPGAGDPQQPSAARAETEQLGVAVAVVPTESAAEPTALAVGLVGASAVRREPVAGDALIYLGVPTGREGLDGTTNSGFCPSPAAAAQAQTLTLLHGLQQQPDLILRAQVLGRGGLAQAAAGLSVGCQVLLDEVPRHPVVLHPKELLLAQTPSRALVVVDSQRVADVLTAAQAQGVAAVVVGQVTAEDRLSVVTKPRGATGARPVCELPLRALRRESPSPVVRQADQTQAVLPLVAREPVATNPLVAPTDPLLAQLRICAAQRPRAAVLVHQCPPDLLLTVQYLAPAERRDDPSPVTTVAAEQALAAAVSAVRETGATPAGAAWLRGTAAASTAVAEGPLDALATQLGMSLVVARAAAVAPDGLVLVVGRQTAGAGSVVRYFSGPGFLVAVLGFDAADAAQQHTAGELCRELIHSGLCATVQAIGQGGLLLALARACASAGVGCTAVLPAAATTPATDSDSGLAVLFRESPGRYLLAIPAHRQADARLLASDRGVPLWPLGRTGGSALLIRRSDGPDADPFTEVLRLPVTTLAAQLQADPPPPHQLPSPPHQLPSPPPAGAPDAR